MDIFMVTLPDMSKNYIVNKNRFSYGGFQFVFGIKWP